MSHPRTDAESSTLIEARSVLTDFRTELGEQEVSGHDLLQLDEEVPNWLILKGARLYSLLKNGLRRTVLKGHDFSRAEKSN